MSTPYCSVRFTTLDRTIGTTLPPMAALRHALQLARRVQHIVTVTIEGDEGGTCYATPLGTLSFTMTDAHAVMDARRAAIHRSLL